MLYFKVEGERGIQRQVLEVSDEHQNGSEWLSRWDFEDFADVEDLAAQASAYLQDGLFLPVDSGDHVRPRYDIVRAPKVGDPVSYSFNGDTRPDGYIVKVGGTNCSRVYTDTGSVYNRRRQTGSWVKRGGTWFMVKGHRNERNPSF